jgi:hypothetical protein
MYKNIFALDRIPIHDFASQTCKHHALMVMPAVDSHKPTTSNFNELAQC